MTTLTQRLQSVILMLDHAFGSLRLSTEEDANRLLGIDLWPATTTALAQFKTLALPTALLMPDLSSRTAMQALQQFLPTIGEISGGSENLAEALAICQAKLRVTPTETLFVAADRVLRGVAVNRGYAVAPHPLVAAYMARGEPLQFVRITGDLEHFSRLAEVIPYYWERLANGSWRLLALAGRLAIAQATAQRLRVETFPLDIATEDLLFIQLDESNQQLVNALEKRKVLFSDGHRVLVAVGPNECNDDFTIYGRHGYLQFLSLSPALLQPAPELGTAERLAHFIIDQWPREKVKITQVPKPFDLLAANYPPFIPSTAAAFLADVQRYSGSLPLDNPGAIVSRHIQHPDNSRTVQALQAELQALGYCTYLQTFNLGGKTLKNVIADLPGTGYYMLDPDLVKQARDIFLKYPLPDPPEPWLNPLKRILGVKWFAERQLDNLPPLQLRLTLEGIFALKPWYPWWLRLCRLPGPGAQLVIVGCHLDSTANSTPGYNPITDPAPGADDDASGIAATLAIARYLVRFAGKLTHTVRFCFFNAEEQGMVGSNVYAAMLKAAGAPVKASICMDMISYNSDAAQIFEIHAGYSDPAIRDLNLPIAKAIAAWAADLGTLAPAQIYKGTIGTNGADRNVYDAAINRSDHASFHQQGYPAVAVSEDFFANLPSEPGVDPNPNYHTNSDISIDSAYASHITCAIAYAISELAR